FLTVVSILASVGLWAAPARSEEPPSDWPSPAVLAEVRAYIKKGWTTLSRSNHDLLAAARDPKLHLPEGRAFPVYISSREDRARVERQLRELVPAADLKQIELRVLPERTAGLKEQGLLYLPRPYVVPGGRFNEMYGWDSYFIQVGLLRDGELERARDMAANFTYEIDKYGTILNANRTYYLTRSQPPFLTEMLLGVYRQDHDKEFLRAAWPAVQAYYRFWTTPPHLVESIGLSRYYDLGHRPAR